MPQTGVSPAPRYDATGVVVDGSLFVFAGRSTSLFDEMWRFDRGMSV